MIRLLPLALVLVVAGDAGATRPTKGRPLVTGQSAVYGAAGERTSGMSRMFNDLGTGVVKDQRTGLFWEKKSDDGGIHDKDATYTWSTGAPWLATGTAFTVFLPALNTPPCHGGFCDWRLPTIQEIESIRSLGRDPAIATAFDSGCTPGCTVITCSCTSTYYHHSSTTSFLYPDAAWYLSAQDGTSDYGLKTFALSARAVRGGAVAQVATPSPTPAPTPTPGPRFVDRGIAVEDTWTGDWWEKKTDDGGIHDKDATFTWAAAETFGNSLTSATFAGRAVWCLPSREKLNGILDATQPGCGAPPLVTPCIAPIFGPTNPDAYWTSEQQDPTTAWAVNFADAVEVQQLRSSARFVRAISSASCL